jgi:hypothetical protein
VGERKAATNEALRPAKGRARQANALLLCGTWRLRWIEGRASWCGLAPAASALTVGGKLDERRPVVGSEGVDQVLARGDAHPGLVLTWSLDEVYATA